MSLRYGITSFLLTFILLLSPARGADRAASWQEAGYGGGGRFTSIAVHPQNPRIVYAASDVAGIYRSRDGGLRFEITGLGLLGFSVADLAVNPQPPHEVAALTGDGLYLSLNQGDSWLKVSGEVSYPSRFFGSRLLLFTLGSLWIATDSKGVFRLPLNNLKATPESVAGLENVKINALAAAFGFLYAGTDRGVFRREDQAWRRQNQGLDPQALEITDLASCRDTLYITDLASSRDTLYVVEKKKGLYRLEKAAGSFEHRPVRLSPAPKGYKALLVLPGQPELVYLGSHPEDWPFSLYRSQDGGANWRSLTNFKTDPEAPVNWINTLAGVEELALAPGTPPGIFLADWWNLWHTADGGNLWSQRHRGLQNTVVNDIKVHPGNPRMIYLCAHDNGLMISEDRGKTWRRAMKGVADGHAQEVEISAVPARLVLLVNPWERKDRVFLYESRDSGATWKDIGFALPPLASLPKRGYLDGTATNVELDPRAPGTIYVGTNGFGVYKTTDGGKTWSPVNTGLATPYIKGPGALRIHPGNPDILFAATLAGGVYKSTNGGGSWQRLTSGERFCFGLAIDPQNPSRIAAGQAGRTILLSEDEGRNWREVELPAGTSPQLAVYSLAFHPERPGVVLAGSLRYDVRAVEGLFLSYDGANSFLRVPQEIPKVNINTIAFVPGLPLTAYLCPCPD